MAAPFLVNTTHFHSGFLLILPVITLSSQPQTIRNLCLPPSPQVETLPSPRSRHGAPLHPTAAGNFTSRKRLTSDPRGHTQTGGSPNSPNRKKPPSSPFSSDPKSLSHRKNPASAQKTSDRNEKPPPARPGPSGPSPSHPRASSTQRTSTSSPPGSGPSASGPTSPSHSPTSQRRTAMQGHRRKGKMSAAAVVQGPAAAEPTRTAPCRARRIRSSRGSWTTTSAT